MSNRPRTDAGSDDTGAAAHAAENAEETARIRELLAELEAAFAQADAERFDAPFTADIVFTAVDGARFVGWEALHAYHRDRLSTPTDEPGPGPVGGVEGARDGGRQAPGQGPGVGTIGSCSVSVR